MTIKQTAGRDALGKFAPDFAHFNDDVLFGENWNNTDLDLKTRSLITVVALVAQGITDSSLAYHIANARKHGVSQKEMASAITHVAFYAGWPKAWAAFNLAKEVYAGDGTDSAAAPEAHGGFFGLGEPNDAYAPHFIGQSYLNALTTPDDYLPIHNVTFEPGCRNNWHVHKATKGGGQTLVCVGGRGYYQEWGKEPVELHSGDAINIPAGVKHWHGAAPDSWFSHLAIEVPGENNSTEWLEPVGDEEYAKLK